MVAVADLNAEVKGQAADPDYALERAVLDIGRARRMADGVAGPPGGR